MSVVCSRDLSDDGQAEDGVIWIPEPEPGHAIGIHVTVCTPDLGWATVQGARPAAGFSLINGDALIVYVSHSPIDDARNRWIEEHRAAAIAASGGKLNADGKIPQDLTMALFGRNEEPGDRLVTTSLPSHPGERASPSAWSLSAAEWVLPGDLALGVLVPVSSPSNRYGPTRNGPFVLVPW